MSRSRTYNYKTVLCEKWKSSRSCPYNKLCMFAHGPEELLTPGEYDKKQEAKKETKLETKLETKQRKRYRKRQSSNTDSTDSKDSNYDIEFPSISRTVSTVSTVSIVSSPPNSPPTIKSPLNPNAKSFKFRRNSSELYIENLEYEYYWKVIHTMILDSCEQERMQQIQQRQIHIRCISRPPISKIPKAVKVQKVPRIVMTPICPNHFHPPYPHLHPGNPMLCTYTFVSFPVFSKR